MINKFKKQIISIAATSAIILSTLQGIIFSGSFDTYFGSSNPGSTGVGESGTVDIGVSAIKQASSWCWVTSTQMSLSTKLQSEGKSILGLSKECIDAANTFYTDYTEQYRDKAELKNLDTFDKQYDNICKKKPDTNKEQCFLVYLGTRLLGDPNPFQTEDIDTVNLIANIVLTAAGLNDRCYIIIPSFDVDIYNNFITSLIYESINNKAPVINDISGHFRLITGIKDGEFIIQETNGQELSKDLNVLENYHQIAVILNSDRFNTPFYAIHLDNDNYVAGNDLIAISSEKTNLYAINKTDKTDVITLDITKNILQFESKFAGNKDNFSIYTSSKADFTISDFMNNYNIVDTLPGDGLPLDSNSDFLTDIPSNTYSSVNSNIPSNTYSNNISSPNDDVPSLVSYKVDTSSTSPSTIIDAKKALEKLFITKADGTKEIISENKSIIFNTNNAKWSFESSSLNKDINKWENFNVQISTSKADSSTQIPKEISSVLSGKDAMVVDLKHTSTFPGKAKIDVNIGTQYKDKEMYVYYLYTNPKTGKITCQLLSTSTKVDTNGNIRIITDHGCDFLFVDKSVATSLESSIDNIIKSLSQ